MTIQDTRQTLTDNEIEVVVATVVERLVAAVGASLRQ
jgi:phenylalanyl-tRNA synthetase beta subunit